MAVAGLDDADMALVDGGEGHLADGVLPGPKSEVDAWSQCIGLEAGFAIQRNDGAVGQGAILAEEHPLLVDDADLVLRDDDRAEEDAQNHSMQNQSKDEQNYPSVFENQIVRCGIHAVELLEFETHHHSARVRSKAVSLAQIA